MVQSKNMFDEDGIWNTLVLVVASVFLTTSQVNEGLMWSIF